MPSKTNVPWVLTYVQSLYPGLTWFLFGVTCDLGQVPACAYTLIGRGKPTTRINLRFTEAEAKTFAKLKVRIDKKVKALAKVA